MNAGVSTTALGQKPRLCDCFDRARLQRQPPARAWATAKLLTEGVDHLHLGQLRTSSVSLSWDVFLGFAARVCGNVVAKKQMDSSSAMTCTRISAIHKRATTTTSMSSMAQHGAGYVIGPDTSRELLVENITSSDHGGGSRLTTWFRRTQKTRRLTLLFRHDAKGAASTRKVLLDLYGTVTAGHSIGSSPSTCAHMAEMRTLAFASSPHPLVTATLNCGQDGAPSLDVS